jgi:WD40 repeat protein
MTVLKGHTYTLHTAAFSGDDKRVVTASDDKTARIWDAESGKELAALKGHDDSVLSAAFSGDRSYLPGFDDGPTQPAHTLKAGSHDAIVLEG